MPWCEDCSKWSSPQSVGEAGECPTCGKVLAPARAGVPWHFKLMLVALTGYMVYRVYWLAEWLPKHL